MSKQFTALAVQLLAGDGKLSLDDPVRKYIPELPDYQVPLTIRHMLTHTSGLRDWGSVESIAGWPRTTREYTHAHVLDIVSRQKSLNFEPGTKWSYSNTGFNLAAIIVVARQRHVVRGVLEAAHLRAARHDAHLLARRSHAHRQGPRDRVLAKQGGEYHIEMPFENVHGNGGLLTTVGDLLTWNENFVEPEGRQRRSCSTEMSDGRPLQRRQAARLRPRPVRRTSIAA